jgi:superfamily I DNA and/or RNA helicase
MTCSMACRLHNFGLNNSFFDYVILDEAGQATEI